MKTVKLYDETHKKILEKIDEMYKKYNIKLSIEGIVNSTLMIVVDDYDIGHLANTVEEDKKE